MAGNKENVLYVILHGLISLVEISGGGFDAYMIDMGADHRYLFGTWLLEKEIPQRNEDIGQDPLVFMLDSVNAATPTPDNTLNPDLNLIIGLNKEQHLPPNLPRVRAVAHLPRPRKIYYFLCGSVAPGSITGDGVKKLVKVPSTISGVRVFEYTFADGVRPQLLAGNPATSTAAWTCPDDLAMVGDRQVATLHFYDEPGVILGQLRGQAHNSDEFSQSSAILGAQLNLSKATAAARPLPPVNQTDIGTLGILEEEIDPLGLRNELLLDFQFKERTGQERPGSRVGTGGGPICGGANALR